MQFCFVGWVLAQQRRLIECRCWVKAQPTLKRFTFLSLVLLMSCTQQLSPGQTVTNSAECNGVCKQHLESCQKTCRNNCIQCNAYAALQTSNSYRRYVHEQCVRGGLVIRRLNSYRDPLQCAKTTCNCSADYQVCKQSCGGVIHKQLFTPPLYQ